MLPDLSTAPPEVQSPTGGTFTPLRDILTGTGRNNAAATTPTQTSPGGSIRPLRDVLSSVGTSSTTGQPLAQPRQQAPISTIAPNTTMAVPNAPSMDALRDAFSGINTGLNLAGKTASLAGRAPLGENGAPLLDPGAARNFSTGAQTLSGLISAGLAASRGNAAQRALGGLSGVTNAVGGAINNPGIQSLVPGLADVAGGVVGEALPYVGGALSAASALAGPGDATAKARALLQAAAETALNATGVGALFTPIVGPFMSGMIDEKGSPDPIAKWIFGHGDYLTTRRNASESMSQIPDWIGQVMQSSSIDDLNYNLNNATRVWSPESRVRFDPQSMQFSGGYEQGDRVLPQYNESLSHIVQALKMLIPAANAGDKHAQDLLEQIRARGRSIHPPDTRTPEELSAESQRVTEATLTALPGSGYGGGP